MKTRLTQFLAICAVLIGSVTAQAHTVEVCWRDDNGVTTFYAGSYHSPYEAPSPVGSIILDGFAFPFSGWIFPDALPGDVECFKCTASTPGSYGTPPAVVHYQTFTSAFEAGSHSISFDSSTVVQSPWCQFPDVSFGGGACTDADFDGICNDDDNCPLDAANDGDGDGICANLDNCPLAYNPDQADENSNGQGDVCEGLVCGNGLVQAPEECDDGNIAGGDGCSAICTLEAADSDGDGVSDDLDVCHGFDDNIDADSDGVPDGCDPCPADNPDDTDGDGVCDSYDPCPLDALDDIDGDGVCDSDDVCSGFDDTADADSDGTPDGCDLCPADPDNDADADGVCGDVDNCPANVNPGQLDNDGDGEGDVCDPDDDGDGVPDLYDNCQFTYNPDQANFDADAEGDACDTDDDGDGVNDALDQCLNTPLGSVVDVTGCAISELCPCDNNWKNHGGYVKCVAHASEDFLEAGLITEEEKDAICSEAGQSACGAKK